MRYIDDDDNLDQTTAKNPRCELLTSAPFLLMGPIWLIYKLGNLQDKGYFSLEQVAFSFSIF